MSAFFHPFVSWFFQQDSAEVYALCYMGHFYTGRCYEDGLPILSRDRSRACKMDLSMAMHKRSHERLFQGYEIIPLPN